MEPSTVPAPTGAVSMSQLARASSETEGPAVSDMAPQNPKTHGRAASTWERIAATAWASSRTPSTTPEASRASTPSAETATDAATMRSRPAQSFSA